MLSWHEFNSLFKNVFNMSGMKKTLPVWYLLKYLSMSYTIYPLPFPMFNSLNKTKQQN